MKNNVKVMAYVDGVFYMREEVVCEGCNVSTKEVIKSDKCYCTSCK